MSAETVQPLQLESLIDHTGSWDWENSHVSQAFVDPTTGKVPDFSINDIVESGTVLIAAGPADLNAAISSIPNASTGNVPEGIRIVPIGLVETAQIGLSKPLSRIFEIGSLLSYIIPGRTVGGISLSRVFFDGPSLLKVMYMGEVKADFADQSNKYAKFSSNPYYANGDTSVESYHKFQHIGSGNLAMNLASAFFNQPTGLAFFFRDRQNDTVSQIYFEGCQVSAYNLGISANMNVLTEAINMEFVRCRPIVTAASYEYTKGTNLADLNIVSASDNQ